MKIVNHQTFLSLPAGTLFSEYEPHVFSGFHIKGDTIDGDYVSTLELSSEIKCDNCDEYGMLLTRALDTGESLDMDFESFSRDGCYNYDQLYAVYDKEDIQALIAALQRCLNV